MPQKIPTSTPEKLDDWSSSFSDLDNDSCLIEARFLCISFSTRKTPHPAIALHFESIGASSSLKAVMYFNAKIQKQIRVEINSKFARFYREILGTVSPARFRKSEQLAKHFIGLTFLCKVEKKPTSPLAIVRKIKLVDQVNFDALGDFRGVAQATLALKNQKRLQQLKSHKTDPVSLMSYQEIRYERKTHESQDLYFERVLNESF